MRFVWQCINSQLIPHSFPSLLPHSFSCSSPPSAKQLLSSLQCIRSKHSSKSSNVWRCIHLSLGKYASAAIQQFQYQTYFSHKTFVCRSCVHFFFSRSHRQQTVKETTDMNISGRENLMPEFSKKNKQIFKRTPFYKCATCKIKYVDSMRVREAMEQRVKWIDWAYLCAFGVRISLAIQISCCCSHANEIHAQSHTLSLFSYRQCEHCQYWFFVPPRNASKKCFKLGYLILSSGLVVRLHTNATWFCRLQFASCRHHRSSSILCVNYLS